MLPVVLTQKDWKYYSFVCLVIAMKKEKWFEAWLSYLFFIEFRELEYRLYDFVIEKPMSHDSRNNLRPMSYDQ